MAKRNRKLEKWEQQAWLIINEWATKWSSRPLPVALEELATAYKVVRVEIQALLGTAGIEKEGNNFVIGVDAGADGVTQREGDILDVSSETWGKLSNPLRFTLAHELSHLILLKIARGVVLAFKDCEPQLETVCNQMAGGLLVPKAALLAELAGRSFDASHSLDVASRFRVSIDTFVLRQNSPDLDSPSNEPGGILALIRQREDGLVFDAVHVHGWRGDQRWGKLKLKAGRENAVVEDLFLLDGVFDRIAKCDHIRESSYVVWRPDTQEMAPCELTTRQLRQDPLEILVGIRITGESLVRKDK